jgi:hypothetical protein
MGKDKFIKPEYDPDMNPVDYFNMHITWPEVMKMFKRVHMIDEYNYCSPKDPRETRKTSDFSINGDGLIRVNSENGCKLPIGKKYTKFMFFARVRHNGNYKAAISQIEHDYLGKHIPYIRVGCDYFKITKSKDRFGISGNTLKGWKKDEIKQDHGKDSLMHISTYDDFCIVPNNKDYKAIQDGNYNLYHEFRHKSVKGELPWSMYMMNHVFGDQIELGWRLMKLYYQHPDRYAPILVIVSKVRETGKSTFINWLTTLFGANMVQISGEALESSFNHIYATANLIAIEETFIEKKHIVEKLKALSTQKEIVVNQKFVSNYKIPFFGKFILTSNNEDKFAIIDEEEVRFFVRKLEKYEKSNHAIEQNLIDEIPAFLYYLENLPDIDFSVSRTGFTKEELINDNLKNVVSESRSALYKDLKMLIGEYIDNNVSLESSEGFYATATDIKNKFFLNNNAISPSYISKVFKNEFNMMPVKPVGETMRYEDVFTEMHKTKVGNPFYFEKCKWSQGNVLQFDENYNTDDNQIVTDKTPPPF